MQHIISGIISCTISGPFFVNVLSIQDINAINEINQLDIRYAQLKKEEEEWGMLKWGK